MPVLFLFNFCLSVTKCLCILLASVALSFNKQTFMFKLECKLWLIVLSKFGFGFFLYFILHGFSMYGVFFFVLWCMFVLIYFVVVTFTVLGGLFTLFTISHPGVVKFSVEVLVLMVPSLVLIFPILYLALDGNFSVSANSIGGFNKNTSNSLLFGGALSNTLMLLATRFYSTSGHWVFDDSMLENLLSKGQQPHQEQVKAGWSYGSFGWPNVIPLHLTDVLNSGGPYQPVLTSEQEASDLFLSMLLLYWVVWGSAPKGWTLGTNSMWCSFMIGGDLITIHISLMHRQRVVVNSLTKMPVKYKYMESPPDMVLLPSHLASLSFSLQNVPREPSLMESEAFYKCGYILASGYVKWGYQYPVPFHGIKTGVVVNSYFLSDILGSRDCLFIKLMANDKYYSKLYHMSQSDKK